MSLLQHYQNLDSHPFTGRHNLSQPIKVKIKENDEHVVHFFDGTEGYEQEKNLTLGKVYEIYAVEGFGDGADAFVKGDDGKETSVMIDMFEEVK